MRRFFASLLLLAIGTAACGGEGRPAPRESVPLVVTTSSGEVVLEVQVADEPDERVIGLMGRERVAPYDGMAFVWPEPVETSFWMKDTLIPLSIAFWDADGRIVSILHMEPCEEEPCPSYDPGVEILGAVEVRRGDLERRGVRVGDRVELGEAAP